MDKTFQLSEEEHKQRYDKIEKDSFEVATPVDKPRIVVSGGQPGSGKSRLIEISKEEFPDGNVVVINGDDLRNYHPDAKEILKLDDKRFAERTDPDSREWTRELFEKAIENKYNIIFESTMRESGPLSNTLMRLKEAGYQITAKVVACHERASATGIYMRYESQKAEKGYGRFSEMASHDAGYDGMPKTIEHIEANKLANKVQVYDRSSNVLYENEIQGENWKEAPKAAEIVKAERSREPTEVEKQQFQSDWERINRLMKDRQATLREFDQANKVYEKYNRQLERGHEKGDPSKSRPEDKRSDGGSERPEQPVKQDRNPVEPKSKQYHAKDIQPERLPGKTGKMRTISGKEIVEGRDKLAQGDSRSAGKSPLKQISGRDFIQSIRRDLTPMDRQQGIDKTPGIERSQPTSGAGRQLGSGQDKGLGRFGGDRGGFETGGGGSER